MTTAVGERKRRYTKDEINNIIRHERILGNEEFSFLSGMYAQPSVGENPHTKETVLAFLKTVTVPVIETEEFETGYFFEQGHAPLLVINDERSMLDYDFISELHPAHDCDMYLWLNHPWEIPDTSLGVYGEWYRREVYKDGILPFDGKTLGWEDSAPIKDEEDNE